MKTLVTTILVLAAAVAGHPVRGWAQPGQTTATLATPDADRQTTADVLDSLLTALEAGLQGAGNHEAHNPYGFAPNERPRYPADVVQERLNRLNFAVPMDYNPVIQQYIDMYTVKYPHALSKLQGLSNAYFPIIEEIFEREGIPQEIKYLCIVESAMNCYARSWAGAVGLWQFMLGTARLYNLRVDTYIDQRHDPVHSTVAAARYLRDLHGMYNDWHLALAAYNCGPGRLNRAIRAAGTNNFWELTEFLPRETRGYVPAFIGAAYAMSYAPEHNIYPGPSPINFLEDSIIVLRQRLSLRDLARETNTPYELLARLNPELKLGTIPYSEKPYALRVPRSTAQAVAERLADAATNHSLATNHPTPATTTSNDAPAGTRLVFHTLAERERLVDVAAAYRVAAPDIVRWNNLQGYEVRPGLRLKIHAPLSVSQYATPHAPRPQAPAAQPARPAAQQPQAAQTRRPQTPTATVKYHTVQNGDSLWAIAHRYGTTVEKVCELNGIPRNGRLNIGQRLRVK